VLFGEIEVIVKNQRIGQSMKLPIAVISFNLSMPDYKSASKQEPTKTGLFRDKIKNQSFEDY
jgi:hypothetical protein